MRMRNLIALGAAGLVIAGCGPDASKQDTGMVVGAVAGGILGNAAGRGGGRGAATIIGAVAGGIIGSEIGRKMDRRDRILAEQAEMEAFRGERYDVPYRWRNPDNGRYGEVVPGPYYRRAYSGGHWDCRDYTHTVYIDGRPEVMRGTACRNPDGTWRSIG